MSQAPVQEEKWGSQPDVDRTDARMAKILCLAAKKKAVFLRDKYHEFKAAGIDPDLIILIGNRFDEYNDLYQGYRARYQELR